MTTLNPQILGRAEHAHRALLDTILADTGLTYHDWVGLTLASGGTLADDAVVDRIRGALHVDAASARAILDGLATAGLLAEVTGEPTTPVHIGLTDAGRALYQGIRGTVDAAMGRVYGHIPADEMATAGRILALVTTRIAAELTPAG